jgi:hypothetical protein
MAKFNQGELLDVSADDAMPNCDGKGETPFSIPSCEIDAPAGRTSTTHLHLNGKSPQTHTVIVIVRRCDVEDLSYRQNVITP